jgi:hypothetical protein
LACTAAEFCGDRQESFEAVSADQKISGIESGV